MKKKHFMKPISAEKQLCKMVRLGLQHLKTKSTAWQYLACDAHNNNTNNQVILLLHLQHLLLN